METVKLNTLKQKIQFRISSAQNRISANKEDIEKYKRQICSYSTEKNIEFYVKQIESTTNLIKTCITIIEEEENTISLLNAILKEMED